jgi:hypothetical protein
MECAAVIDACIALNLLSRAQGDEIDQVLASLVRMLSKMCRISE